MLSVTKNANIKCVIYLALQVHIWHFRLHNVTHTQKNNNPKKCRKIIVADNAETDKM